MKTRYLKGILTVGFAAVLLLFSSCLKDDAHYFNAETVPNLAELPLSGLYPNYFGADAVTKAGIDTITFAVGVTAANPPTTPTAVTLAVDTTLMVKYNAANPAIVYHSMPAAAYKLAATTVTIPAGVNSTLTTVIIDRTQLNPAMSYMLPVKIASASGLPISANYSVHYYHVIGNDFAGPYTQNFQRFNEADSLGAFSAGSSFTGHSALFSPVSPIEFTVPSGYAGGDLVYDVTFTKNSNGTYSNFAVSFTPASIVVATGAGISVTAAPQFLLGGGVESPTIPGPLTKAQALKIFHFQFGAHTTADRYLIDTFY